MNQFIFWLGAGLCAYAVLMLLIYTIVSWVFKHDLDTDGLLFGMISCGVSFYIGTGLIEWGKP